jgi:hypothetical protein
VTADVDLNWHQQAEARFQARPLSKRASATMRLLDFGPLLEGTMNT